MIARELQITHLKFGSAVVDTRFAKFKPLGLVGGSGSDKSKQVLVTLVQVDVEPKLKLKLLVDCAFAEVLASIFLSLLMFNIQHKQLTIYLTVSAWP